MLILVVAAQGREQGRQGEEVEWAKRRVHVVDGWGVGQMEAASERMSRAKLHAKERCEAAVDWHTASAAVREYRILFRVEGCLREQVDSVCASASTWQEQQVAAITAWRKRRAAEAKVEQHSKRATVTLARLQCLVDSTRVHARLT